MKHQQLQEARIKKCPSVEYAKVIIWVDYIAFSYLNEIVIDIIRFSCQIWNSMRMIGRKYRDASAPASRFGSSGEAWMCILLLSWQSRLLLNLFRESVSIEQFTFELLIEQHFYYFVICSSSYHYVLVP